MSFAHVNGINICYEIHGKGYPVILIPGFSCKKEIFRAQVGALSEEFKTILFDNRGTGKSDRPDVPHTMEMLAEDVRGLLDFLAFKKANIIGWAFGGMIAQHFVLKYPERVNKLVLWAANYKGTGIEDLTQQTIKGLELRKKLPEKYFWRSSRLVFFHKFRKEMEANPSKKFHGLWSVEDLIKDNTIDPPTPKDIENQAHAIAGHNTLERLHEITNETLLFGASHERICPVSILKEMNKRIPNSKLKIIQKAGHYCLLSKAPEANQILIEFLKE
ncbi:AB hydrolase superfamily protein YdjP [subsurface metagenome]